MIHPLFSYAVHQVTVSHNYSVALAYTKTCFFECHRWPALMGQCLAACRYM